MAGREAPVCDVTDASLSGRSIARESMVADVTKTVRGHTTKLGRG